MNNSKESFEARIRLAKQIKNARLASRITQLAISKILGIARQTYLDIEYGRTEPKAIMVMNIASATNRSLDYFLSDKGEIQDEIVENATETIYAIEKQILLLKRELAGKFN